MALRHSWRGHNRPGRLILDPGSAPAFAMKRQWLRACVSPRKPHQFHWKAALEVINRAANAEYLDPDKEARDSPSHAKTRIVAGILPILMVPFCLELAHFVRSRRATHAWTADTSNNGQLSTRRVIVPPAPAIQGQQAAAILVRKEFKLARTIPEACFLGLTRNRWIAWR